MSHDELTPSQAISGWGPIRLKGQPPVIGGKISCYARFFRETIEEYEDVPYHTSGATENPPYVQCWQISRTDVILE